MKYERDSSHKEPEKVNLLCMEIKLDQVCKSWIYSAYTKLNVAWYVQCGFLPLKSWPLFVNYTSYLQDEPELLFLHRVQD